MKRKEKQQNSKARLPFRKNRCFDWIIVGFIFAVILTAVLFEAGTIIVPTWALQKTGDNVIYQTLFSAQASMVGIVLAVLALLTSIVDNRAYGMSVSEYVMKIRPLRIFRHGWIIVESIVLIVLTWLCVALNLNDLVIALFITTTALLVRLTLDVLNVMHSSIRLNVEIGNYLISAVTITYITNLFNEINEALASGNAVLLQKDVFFAKGLNNEFLVNAKQEDINNLNNLFLLLIHTAYETRSPNSDVIIDLYVTTIENANRKKKAFQLSYSFSAHETYQLFSAASTHHLYGGSGSRLLFRWQKTILTNATFAGDDNPFALKVASDLYSFTYMMRPDAVKKIGYNILSDAQFLQDERYLEETVEISPEIAKENYINLITKLFRERDEGLLNTLFGFDGREAGISFKPLCNRYGQFELTKINVFIVVYLYYKSYFETTAKNDEKKHYEDALKRVAQPFWRSITRNPHIVAAINSNIKESFDFLMEKIRAHEHSGEYSYGMSSVREMRYEYVVLDFVIFSLAHFNLYEDELDIILDALMPKSEQWTGTSLFSAISRYVIHNAIEDYKRFYSIMRGHRISTAEDEYEKLRSVLTNLYVKRRIEKAEHDSAEYLEKQSIYEQLLSETISSALDNSLSPYSQFDNKDNPFYEPLMFRFHVPVSDIRTVVETEDFFKVLWPKLNNFVFDKIRDKLNLTEVALSAASASKFFLSINEIENADILFGHALFSHNDPEYEKYLQFMENCSQIDAWGLGLIVAANSQLINVGIRDVSVKIRHKTESEIEYDIEMGEVMSINDYKFEMDSQSAYNYLQKSMRVLEVNLEIAVETTKEIVGGGLLYEDNF